MVVHKTQFLHNQIHSKSRKPIEDPKSFFGGLMHPSHALLRCNVCWMGWPTTISWIVHHTFYLNTLSTAINIG